MRLIRGGICLLPFLWLVSSARASELPQFELPELSPDETRYAAEFERGSGFWSEQKYEEALQVYEGIEAKIPGCVAAQFCVGAALGAVGKYDASVAKMTKVIKANPGYPVCRAYRAWVYLKQKKWEPALEDLNAYIKARPGNSWSVLWRGWCLLESCNIEETMRVYCEKHAGDPEAAKNYRLENANVESALKDFESVLSTSKFDEDAIIGKALGLAMVGDRAGAREALWELGDEEERSLWVVTQEIRVYQYLYDSASATARARALVERDPTNYDSWSLLAGASSKLQEVSEEAVRRNPEDPGAHLWRGMCAAYVDLDAGREEILKSRELDRPGFGKRMDWLRQEAARETANGRAWYRIRLLLVLAISGTGDVAAARAFLERGEFRDCRDSELTWVRFRIEVDDGKFKDAVARLDEFLDKTPQILDRIKLIESHPALHAFAESQEYRDWKIPPGQK